MATRTDHHTAEQRFRALLGAERLPQPDEVSYWRDAVVLGWRAPKAVVVLDLDEVDDLDGFDTAALAPYGLTPLPETG